MGKKSYACVTILPNRFVLLQQKAIILTLTLPITIGVPTRRALVLVTKDSFASLVTNLSNKNNVCKKQE